MLIFKIGHGACYYLVGPYWQSIVWLFLIITKLLLNYLTYKTKNCRLSIDVYFEEIVAMPNWVLLPIAAANSVGTHHNDQGSNQFPDLQNRQSWTFYCLWFSSWNRELVSRVFDNRGGQYIIIKRWYTKFNILQFTVGYLNATIYAKIWKPEPQSQSDGPSQTRPIPRIDGYRFRYGPQTSMGLGFWTNLELNKTVLMVQNLHLWCITRACC